MKEIWIEKLWELLNDFEDYKEKEYWYANYDWRLHEISDEEEWVERWITAFRIDESELWVEESIAVIICKGYGFCEWLVQENKIKDYYEWNDDIDYVREKYWFYEALLMLLAISNSPIEDLILYLK